MDPLLNNLIQHSLNIFYELQLEFFGTQNICFVDSKDYADSHNIAVV